MKRFFACVVLLSVVSLGCQPAAEAPKKEAPSVTEPKPVDAATAPAEPADNAAEGAKE